MTGVIPPVAKGVYVCDDVFAGATGKPTVVNLLDAVVVPAGTAFPHRVAKLCVFAWLRGGRGTVEFAVELVDAQTDRTLRRVGPTPLTFAAPNTSVYAVARFQDVLFPRPGLYLVNVYCDGRFLDDQPVTVIEGNSRG